MQASSIYIEYLESHYVLSRSPANPRSIQRRLDEVARQRLIRNLDRYLELPNDAATMWFVEHVNIDLELNLTSDDEILAGAWADKLCDGILRALRHDDNVVVFRDRAEYLATLIEHLLRGSSVDYWYFKELPGLGSLPMGQAISKLLREDADDGRDAMIELTRRGGLELFLAALSEAELVDIVSECLLPTSPSVITPNSYASWTRSLRSLLDSSSAGLTSAASRNLTQVYLSLLRVEPGLGPDVNLARFIRDLLQLSQSILAVPDYPAFLRMVASEEIAHCLRNLGERDGGPLLVNLIRNSGGVETAALLGQLKTTNAPISRLGTDFGGIFLLAPAILELGVAPLLELCPYPDPPLGPKTGLLLYLIALQCLGPNAPKARQDRSLATFAGLRNAPSPQLISEYGESLTPAKHRKFADLLGPIIRNSRQPRGPGLTASGTEWFTLSAGDESILGEPGFDLALSGVSKAILQTFASKLGAFSDSSPSYLFQNFLASRAIVEVSTENILVRFLTCPLQMILRMAGFDQQRWQIPWADSRTLELRFE